MPSTQVFPRSGGIQLVAENITSGQLLPVGGVNLKLSASGPGPVFVCTPNLSGSLGTLNSGGSFSSGGLADGWELSPGDTYFVPRILLVSGLQSITLVAPAASSGGRVFWQMQ